MTLLHTGATGKYSDNWDKAFGGKKKTTAKKKSTAKKASAKKRTSTKKKSKK